MLFLYNFYVLEYNNNICVFLLFLTTNLEHFGLIYLNNNIIYSIMLTGMSVGVIVVIICELYVCSLEIIITTFISYKEEFYV